MFYLVKTDGINGPADVDTTRADTVDLTFLQSTLGEYNPNSESCGQGWRDSNGDQVHGANKDIYKCFMLLNLE